MPCEMVETAIVMNAVVRYTEMKRTERFGAYEDQIWKLIADATIRPTSIVPGTNSAV